MLESLKESLRIKHDSIDCDLEELIGACKLDLKRVGIVKIDDRDQLIRQAIKIYVKAQLNFEGEGERYQRAYEGLRDSISLCGDYNV